MRAPILLRNIYWGIRWALIFALLFVAWATVLLIFGGSAVFRKQGITFPELIFGYIAGGCGAGMLIGAFRPWLSSRIGAALIGIVATVPVGFAFMFATQPDWLGTDSLLTVATMSVVLGGSCGLAFREIFADSGDSKKRRNRAR